MFDRTAVEAWIADDPDPATRRELEVLLAAADDPDAAADKRVMDRVRASLVRGHAMNQSQSQDLLPGL